MLKNLRVETNADVAFGIRWKDSTNTPYQLSSAAMQIRDEANVLILQAQVTIDPIEGWATFLIPAADIAPIDWNVHPEPIWDAILTRADGRTIRPYEGKVLVSKGVTVV